MFSQCYCMKIQEHFSLNGLNGKACIKDNLVSVEGILKIQYENKYWYTGNCMYDSAM